MAYRKSHIPDFPKLAKAIAKVAAARVSELGDEYADFVRADFVDRIERQRFASFQVVLYPETGTNLSPQWIERKAAKGADPRTMIATGHYLRNIRTFRRSQNKGREIQWRVGFDPRVKARDLDGKPQKITLETVAMIHEHGNSMTPARPHWGPNARRLKRGQPKLRARMQKEVRFVVHKAVKGKMAVGGPV